MKSNYSILVEAVIKYQESVIGPLAWNEASKVPGLSVSSNNVTVTGDGKTVLSGLVHQYENLFGKASVEACRDAVRPFLTKMKDVDLPTDLL